MTDIIDRFLTYVSYETTSGEPQKDQASSMGQYVLAQRLQKELANLGLKTVKMNGFGTVSAVIAGDQKGPTIALIAHLDTSNAASGAHIHPRLLTYEGGKIELSPGIYLDPIQFKSLTDKKGHRLIVTDGTTLLGGDDKAGIAIIMTVVEKIISEKISHLPLEVIFTTDEEIGVGADHVLDEEIQADFGYTIDGGGAHLINIENFNAASISVDISGRSIHPGDAKDKMINAINVGWDFHSSLPKYERPEHTEKREGFYHLLNISGSEERCRMKYIVRDHDLTKLLHRLDLARLAAARINDSYGGSKIIDLTIDDNSYRNMKPELDKHPEVVDRITAAYDKLGIKYYFEPIRGGTDGASLTYRGLPCPNLGTGDYNCHGRFEYVDVEEMTEMVNLVLEIIKG